MIDIPRTSKRDVKYSKILQKEIEDLNKDVQALNRRMRDKNNQQSQSEHEVVDKKAKRWWSRVDDKYFNIVQHKQYQEKRDVTTSNRILQQQLSKETIPLTTYADLRIISQYEVYAEKSLVHVFFRNKFAPYYCLVSYQLQEVIPSYSDQRRDKKSSLNITVTPTRQKNIRFAHEIDEVSLKQIKLSLSAINDDEQFCKQALEYKGIADTWSDANEIQRQVFLWQRQLTQANVHNNLHWDKLIVRTKEKSQTNSPINSQEIQEIKEHLMWVTVLKYFEHGLSDKTMEMLQALIESYKLIRPAKSKNVNNKKFFETDCKICFCSLNNDCNQVLYCDKCDTSFHLACYGLKEIPKDQVYYCDCCKFQKANQKKVSCQLCNRSSFPIKQLDGHFYHATCLLLLNLVCIRRGSLVLRQDITHKTITQMVIQSEIQNSQCQFCSKATTGFRFKCSHKNCNKSSHPICAYLNGCKYQVKRDAMNQKLQVAYCCNNHDINRNWIQQIYIRRYMCNLNETADLSWNDFLKNFQKDKSKQSGKGNKLERWSLSRITNKTSMIKKMLQKQQNKNSQNNQVETQSRRMLQKLKTSKQGK